MEHRKHAPDSRGKASGSGRRITLGIAVGLPVALFGSTMSAARTPAEIFAQVSPSVWTVKATNPEKTFTAQGSAVVIGKRRLVTACHMVTGAATVVVSHNNEERQVHILRTSADPDPARDMCVLTTDADIDAPVVEFAPIASVKVGDPAYAIGSPLGLELTLTSGLVSALRKDATGAITSIQASAAIAHGSSGGGLFDAQGRLMGITVGSAGEVTELGFSVPAQALISLPERRAEALGDWATMLTNNGVKLNAQGEPIASGFATIEDVTKLPAVGPKDGILGAYRQFLLKSRPRAFVVTSDGQWGTVTDADTLQAIINGCVARHAQCAVYAVDNAVVWTGS